MYSVLSQLGRRQKDSVLGVKSATGYFEIFFENLLTVGPEVTKSVVSRRRAPLSMYTNPPMEELTLTQFENYALDRLAGLLVLRSAFDRWPLTHCASWFIICSRQSCATLKLFRAKG